MARSGIMVQITQRASAAAGAGFAVVLLVVAWGNLTDDAPDMPRTAAVALLCGAVILALTFAAAAVRPRLGLFLSRGAFPVYLFLVLAARQSTGTGHAVPPPPGMSAPDAPPGGLAGLLLALVALGGVPCLALLGVFVSARTSPAGRPHSG